MLGTLLISFAFAAALISMVAYAIAGRTGSKSAYTIARTGFHAAVVAFMFAGATHVYNILTHQYQFTYVWKYSSNSLSTPLLMASSYAGQEGSFMLWTLFVAIIGVFVLGYAQRVRYEAPVMAIYSLVFTGLLMILIVKSPFETLWKTFPNETITQLPADGRGLNPSLENIWITIHPPILFAGFAAMTVPFVFALAGLIKRDFQKWITISLPWALFASMVLGFGIALGGWWAYETLGWGGFWAWDPVENSSLIPWLACVALVHTMLVQRRTGGTDRIGGLVKTNFVLAIAAFGLILYSTFLTRSGILGDTSVHSFVDPGAFVYAVLLGILLLFMGIGFGTLIWRWRDLKIAAMEYPLMSRETALTIGSMVLMFSAIVVLIGTSAPIFLPMFNLPKIAIPQDFYNSMHLPLAILLVIVNGISMTLKWKSTTQQEFLRKIALATGIALLGTVLLVVLGVHDPIYVALGFGSVLAIVINVQIGSKVVRGNPKMIGAYVSHIGIGLMMLGIIATARYSETKHVQLVEGESKKVFDYKITYQGAKRIDEWRPDQEKFEHNILLEKNGSKEVVSPITFLSDFNKRESPFMEPGILYTPTRDIYVSPKAYGMDGGNPVVELHKGEKSPVPFDSSVVVRFEKFDMSRAQSDQMQGAVMEVTSGDSVYYLTSYYKMSEGRGLPVTVPNTKIEIAMVGLNTDSENLSNSQVILQFASPSYQPPPERASITVDVSVKPFISLFWGGVIIMVTGFFFAILRRRKELARLITREESDTFPPTGHVHPPRSRSSRQHAPSDEESVAARSVARR
jgi:cytochrome c-type biogenesis protein CcmF